jgi:CHAT domain-containing protein/Tfp pilus assembly protein PilF
LKTRNVQFFNHTWLLWAVGLMFSLWLGCAVPAHAAPPGQGEDTQAKAYDLLEAGVALHKQGDLQGALAKFQAALPLLQEIGDRSGEAAALGNIGAVYSAMGQQEQALPYLKQALALTRQIGDRRGEAYALNSIGGAYYFLSDFPQALDYLQQALAVHGEIGNQNGEATTLVNIGTIYFELDQPQEALTYFQQALPILRQVGDRTGEANALSHIGGIYDETLGQLPQALNYYQQALAIYREVEARQGEGQQLNNIGDIYRGLGQLEQALESFKLALTIVREIGDRWAEAQLLTNLGVIYGELGQSQQAIASLEDALPLRREIGDRAGESNTLNNLGTLYRGLGQPQQALQYFQQALPIARDIGDRAGEVIMLDNMGITYLSLGQNDAALIHLRRSIELIESIRSEMSLEELKGGFAAQYTGAYQTIVPLLITMGRPEEAFTYAERARARAFLDQLGNVRVDPRQGADSALVEAEQRLADEIADLDRRQRELLGQPGDSQTDTLIADLQTRLAGKRAEYADLLIQLKLFNPAYATLVTVEPLTLTQIQAEVLAENTTLVSYFITAEQTVAFVVSRDIFVAVPINVARANLADRVVAFRSLLTLEAENPSAQLTTDRLAAAQALYALLLAPLSPSLPTASVAPTTPRPPSLSLIIVPHDILHYLPFAALVNEAGTSLSAQFTLSLAPSASALSYAQANQSPDKGQLLALGNPTTELSPLPYAEQEVEAIAALYPQQTSLRGANATETAFRAEVSGADWVHLAAHAQLNPTSPLFSALYLAEEPTAKPSAGAENSPTTTDEDGRLEVREVLNLDLTGVNGVILSACETALGEQSRGDELVGLTRAFLYAGTPLVVASLWEVEDEATAALMTAFHQHLRTGLGAAAALRAAQAEIQQDSRWAAPYYWAGFQVIGDGGPGAEVAGDTETQGETTTPVAPQPDHTGLIRLVAGLAGLLVLLSLIGWRVWRWRSKR